jgi:hypothetical protein
MRKLLHEISNFSRRSDLAVSRVSVSSVNSNASRLALGVHARSASRRRCLVRDKRTSSANGERGRHPAAALTQPGEEAVAGISLAPAGPARV